jgi:hypothetical protein
VSKAYLQGRPRDAAPGKRPWRVRAYSPGPGFPRGRVVFKDAETGKLATRTPDDGHTLEELFDLVERALGQNVALARTPGARDLTALADRYLEWLRGQGRDPDYITRRRCSRPSTQPAPAPPGSTPSAGPSRWSSRASEGYG